MVEDNDVFVSTLLHADEYAKHLNQVAGLTTRDIKFLRRKFVSTFLSRRHRLIFSMNDGTQLIWKTIAGDYKYQQPRAEKIVEFARSRGLLQDSSPRHRQA
jgi:hypothetical protein